MQLKNILNNGLKFSGLALLALNLNSCSSKNPKEDPRYKTIEGYLQAIHEINLEDIKSYCTKRKAKGLYAPEEKLEILKEVFEDSEIFSYIPKEGIDNDDVYWVKKQNGYYAKFVLIEEDSKWKIDEISPSGD